MCDHAAVMLGLGCLRLHTHVAGHHPLPFFHQSFPLSFLLPLSLFPSPPSLFLSSILPSPSLLPPSTHTHISVLNSWLLPVLVHSTVASLEIAMTLKLALFVQKMLSLHHHPSLRPRSSLPPPSSVHPHSSTRLCCASGEVMEARVWTF